MKKAIALTVVLVLALSLLAASAYADVNFTPTGECGWYTDDGYAFSIGHTTYEMPYGTVCSRTSYANYYSYVFPIQYILTDFADYHQTWGFNPQGIDGSFGANTASAVSYFQNRYGLQVDGCVGDETWSAFVDRWVFGASY